MVLTLTKEKKPLLKKQIIRLDRLFAWLLPADTSFIVLKSCPSNYLVDQIKLILSLRILELSIKLSEVFPKSKICVTKLYSSVLNYRGGGLIRRGRGCVVNTNFLK